MITANASAIPNGSEFAGCRIVGQIGAGGMGVVYRATHLSLDIDVAIKVILPQFAEDPDYRNRFLRERKVAARFRHEHAVRTINAGEERGYLYAVMDYIDGENLDARISRSKGLSPAEAAGIVSQIASALDSAHAQGLVHRDIKPANILIEPRDGKPYAYLADFGLARVVDSSTALTQTGAALGTYPYMSPEQILGKTVDKRSDIYALGVVLYQALTADWPFSGSTIGSVINAVLNDPIPEAANASPAVNAVIAKALAKDPAARYQSAGELGQAAVAAASAGKGRVKERAPQPPPSAAPTPKAKPKAHPPPKRSSVRKRLVLALVLVVVAAAAAAAIASSHHSTSNTSTPASSSGGNAASSSGSSNSSNTTTSSGSGSSSRSTGSSGSSSASSSSTGSTGS